MTLAAYGRAQLYGVSRRIRPKGEAFRATTEGVRVAAAAGAIIL